MPPPTPPEPRPDAYARAGVNITAGTRFVEAIAGLAAATARPGVPARAGGFAAPLDPKAVGLHDPIFFTTTDGVGTKILLTTQTGRHDVAGYDLVAMCVNDLLCHGARPLVFLDYIACAALNPDVARKAVEGMASACKIAGCALAGGETAEMPGLYRGDALDMAGFAVGAAERHRVLPRGDAREGDVVLGLASGGLHANGFSLVRAILEASALTPASAFPPDPARTLADVVLEPTRIYVPSVLGVLDDGAPVRGLAHITGGGLAENIPRAFPDAHLTAHLDLSAVVTPSVFGWLQEAGGVSTTEMRRVFNCGIGMVAIVDAHEADSVARALEEKGETVHTLGVVRAGARGVCFADTP